LAVRLAAADRVMKLTRLSSGTRDEPLIKGAFDGLVGNQLCGWAYDANHPERRLSVELIIDGQLRVECTADKFREDLQNAGLGDGHHAFALELPLEMGAGHHDFLVREAQTSVILDGGTQRVSVPQEAFLQGAFDGVRAGFATGWAFDRRGSDAKVVVSIMETDREIGRGIAECFRLDLNRARIGYGFHGFVIELPPDIDDGHVHRLTAVVMGSQTRIGHEVEYAAADPFETAGSVRIDGTTFPIEDCAGALEDVGFSLTTLRLGGWAARFVERKAPREIVVFRGRRLLGRIPVHGARSDIAPHMGGLSICGFLGEVPVFPSAVRREAVRVFALFQNSISELRHPTLHVSPAASL